MVDSFSLVISNIFSIFRLKRGTEVNKRHAPVWQAWGVLETRHDNPEEARNIFQQGIWACAQLGGGQSGGYKCARLWQAWGVLEAKEGDIAAARRCFSRALDADKRNMAAMTAWTIMEEEIGNLQDTRVLFERALKQFTSASAEKKNLWRAYELMEQRAGNTANAKEVFQRALRESFRAAQEQEDKDDRDGIKRSGISLTTTAGQAKPKESKSDNTEREVSRWERGSSMQSEVWMNNGSIEGKVPKATMNKQRKPKKDTPPV
jgi:tetratricopeptide (TPR) repeat protein